MTRPEGEPVTREEKRTGGAVGGFSIDDGYQEDLRLRDGTRIRLRTVRPSDKQRLVDGLARLSVESQHGRFFAAKTHFTDAELRYLTELDSINHFAVGAVAIDRRHREGAGLGIARFVRLPGHPEVAEAAVAVVDEMQNRGIGRLLLERLVAAAVERGVTHFRCEALASNNRIRSMVTEAFAGVSFESRGQLVVAEFPLPERVTLSHGSSRRGASRFSDILRLAARRLVVFRFGRALTRHPDHEPVESSPAGDASQSSLPDRRR